MELSVNAHVTNYCVNSIHTLITSYECEGEYLLQLVKFRRVFDIHYALLPQDKELQGLL